MKTLTIYAHPNTPGHCPKILQEVQNNLDSKKGEYEPIDLYGIGYDPVLQNHPEVKESEQQQVDPGV